MLRVAATRVAAMRGARDLIRWRECMVVGLCEAVEKRGDEGYVEGAS